MRSTRLLGLAAAAVFCLAFAGRAQALTLTLDQHFGSDPASGFIELTFNDVAPNTVQLVMDTNGLDDPDEFVSQIYFNFDGDANTLGFPDAILIAPPLTIISTSDSPSFQADGDGKYNVQLDFDTTAGKRFGIDTVLSMSITGTGIVADDFNVLAEVGGGNGPFFAAAHIQGTGAGGAGSDWIGAGGGSPPVPEPTGAFLFGAGALIFAGTALRARR